MPIVPSTIQDFPIDGNVIGGLTHTHTHSHKTISTSLVVWQFSRTTQPKYPNFYPTIEREDHSLVRYFFVFISFCWCDVVFYGSTIVCSNQPPHIPNSREGVFQKAMFKYAPLCISQRVVAWCFVSVCVLHVKLKTIRKKDFITYTRKTIDDNSSFAFPIRLFV